MQLNLESQRIQVFELHLDILPVQLGNVHPWGETSMVRTDRGAKSTDAIVVFVQVKSQTPVC